MTTATKSTAIERSDAAQAEPSLADTAHTVQFYESEEFLYQVVGDYLAIGLLGGQVVVVVATEEHRHGFARHLKTHGLDLERAAQDGRAIVLDAHDMLDQLIVGDMPDGERFHSLVGGVVAAASARSAGAPLRAYGEMVDVLWRAGRRAAALRLEQLWNQLAEVQRFSLLCAYASDGFHRAHGLTAVCAEHSHVLPPESNGSPVSDSRDVRWLIAEISRRNTVEHELRASVNELRKAETAARTARGDLEDFLDRAPVPIHSIDTQGTIVYANRAELALLGYSAEEYVGRSISSFHADPDALADMLARLERGETLCDYEARLRARDGSILHVLISSNMAVKDGKPVATRCFTRNITDRKRTEEERDALIADLSRTIRLNDMFAGILGHDLRGPLSTIVMAAQLLLDSSDDAKSVRTVQRILSSASRMQLMIGQLLDFTRVRMDGGLGLERATIDIADIARDVIEEIRFAHPHWQVDLDVRGDVRGELDGDRLSQVFSNLIGNAVQHGSPQHPIRVSMDGSDPRAIRVEIENRGEIAHEVLPALFSPFRASQNRTVRGQGLGLGLFITDHIVRAHGGQITVESANDSTVFRFDLPRQLKRSTAIATFDAHAAEPSEPGLSDPGLRTSPMPEGWEQRIVQEAARQHEERFRLLVESVKDYAIFMLDPDGHVATWNAGAQRIKGYTADEIIGQHFSKFYPEVDIRAGKTEYELAIAQRDGRFEDEGWRLRKDGSRFWANVVITALRDRNNVLVGFAKVTRDLTERRKLEQDRVQLAHAQEAVRLRDEFLSLASHELKTPLTVLQLQLEALRDRIDPGNRGMLGKVDRSVRAGHRLAELVEALLDVSRIATGRFELNLERADIAEIVEGAADRMNEAADAAGCALTVTAEHAIGRWDRTRLDQLVTNLISNATKYAAGTPIEIAVTCEGGEVVIAVRDRGPGVPEQHITRIFERFERGASMRHFGGLGLGLYLVRQITEAHGGTVTATNPDGGGACFMVRLPLAVPQDSVVT